MAKKQRWLSPNDHIIYKIWVVVNSFKTLDKKDHFLYNELSGVHRPACD